MTTFRGCSAATCSHRLRLPSEVPREHFRGRKLLGGESSLAISDLTTGAAQSGASLSSETTEDRYSLPQKAFKYSKK